MTRPLLALAALLCLLGCERPDPQLQRRFELQAEEHGRLLEAIGGEKTQTVPATRATVESLRLLSTENERLRETLLKRQREQALEKSRGQRAEIERAVEEIRGLRFKTPVDYNVLNRAEIKAVIAGKLGEVYSEQEFRDISAALTLLGLLPENYPLREKYVELLSEQVAAFFDQHTHKLFMYEDASLDNAQNRVVLAHELTHALQDQHFGLKRLPLEIKTNDDRAAAASALCEGDATLVMSEYMLKNLSLQALKDNLTGALSQDMKQLAEAPRYLREMLIFPYLRGQEFCGALFAEGGYGAINRAYEHLPSSTTQVLHPEKYLIEPREEPMTVEVPVVIGNEHQPIVDNVVGEMGIRILFTEWLDQATGERVAEGWRGDRYQVFDAGRVLVWKSAWASEEDAAEFFAAETQALTKRHHLTSPRRSPRSFEADGPRFVLVVQNAVREVLVIDAAASWADVLRR